MEHVQRNVQTEWFSVPYSSSPVGGSGSVIGLAATNAYVGDRTDVGQPAGRVVQAVDSAQNEERSQQTSRKGQGVNVLGLSPDSEIMGLAVDVAEKLLAQDEYSYRALQKLYRLRTMEAREVLSVARATKSQHIVVKASLEEALASIQASRVGVQSEMDEQHAAAMEALNDYLREASTQLEAAERRAVQQIRTNIASVDQNLAVLSKVVEDAEVRLRTESKTQFIQSSGEILSALRSAGSLQPPEVKKLSPVEFKEMLGIRPIRVVAGTDGEEGGDPPMPLFGWRSVGVL